MRDFVTKSQLCSLPFEDEDKDLGTAEYYYCHWNATAKKMIPRVNIDDEHACRVTVVQVGDTLQIDQWELELVLKTCADAAVLQFVTAQSLTPLESANAPIVVELHHPLRIESKNAAALSIDLPEQGDSIRRLIVRPAADYSDNHQCAVEIAQDHTTIEGLMVHSFPTTGLCVSGSNVALRYLHTSQNGTTKTVGHGMLVTGENVAVSGAAIDNTGYGIYVSGGADGFHVVGSQTADPWDPKGEIYVGGNAKGGILFFAPPPQFGTSNISSVFSRLTFRADQITSESKHGSSLIAKGGGIARSPAIDMGGFSPTVSQKVSGESGKITRADLVFSVPRPTGTNLDDNDHERLQSYGRTDGPEQKFFPLMTSCEYQSDKISCDIWTLGGGGPEPFAAVILSYQRAGEVPSFTAPIFPNLENIITNTYPKDGVPGEEEDVGNDPVVTAQELLLAADEPEGGLTSADPIADAPSFTAPDPTTPQTPEGPIDPGTEPEPIPDPPAAPTANGGGCSLIL
ncbi:MAG: hypothetical protein HYV02_02055 [Deltaproteobacteria bacterium]|nr:hypothetical protein [Deltaproteobacteria bacterium]